LQRSPDLHLKTLLRPEAVPQRRQLRRPPDPPRFSIERLDTLEQKKQLNPPKPK